MAVSLAEARPLGPTATAGARCRSIPARPIDKHGSRPSRRFIGPSWRSPTEERTAMRSCVRTSPPRRCSRRSDRRHSSRWTSAVPIFGKMEVKIGVRLAAHPMKPRYQGRARHRIDDRSPSGRPNAAVPDSAPSVTRSQNGSRMRDTRLRGVAPGPLQVLGRKRVQSQTHDRIAL